MHLGSRRLALLLHGRLSSPPAPLLVAHKELVQVQALEEQVMMEMTFQGRLHHRQLLAMNQAMSSALDATK